MYIYMSRFRNVIWRGPYCVLYARATRAAIARPRDCTFFHNYSTFFHNSTTTWTTILFLMHRHSSALILSVTDAAARTINFY